jgi:hypothetical protein
VDLGSDAIFELFENQFSLDVVNGEAEFSVFDVLIEYVHA